MRRMAVALASLCIGGCGSGSDDSIKIGMNASLSGELAQFGATAERVAELAVDKINDQGGVNGRPLKLIVLDDGTDPAAAAANTDTLIARGDIVAMIGPVFSAASAQSMPAIKANQLVSISGSATSPALTLADDGGYFFRDVPQDNFQGVAMGKYLWDVASPRETDVALVYQDDSYGQGLANSFMTDYTTRGGNIMATVTFAPGLATQTAVDDLWTQIVNAGAPMVVLITFSGDGAKIIQKWDDSGDLPSLRWFFTDGVRDSNFAQSRPQALEGMRGTAPTHAQNDTFSNFAADYENAWGSDITQEVFQPNYYDAVYLLALALQRQAFLYPEEPLGGEHLRDAMFEIGGPNAAVTDPTISPENFADALGGSIDVNYDGASGPCDFDQNGDSVGPYEVWKITGGMYVQDQYLDPQQLTGGM